MNIFGMGPLEIVLIMVIALIVFGPAKLPEIMGQVGRAIAEIRRTTSVLSDEFNRTIQAELQETRALVDDTKSAVTGVHTSISSAITSTAAATAAPVRTTLPGDAVATANGTNGTSGTNGTAPAQAAPPLADTSQWSWEAAAPAPGQPAAEASTSAPTATVPTAAPASEPTVERPPKPRTPPPPTRRINARDELLPPY
jgi:sec-independent protein translocase protein TatB